MTKLSIRSLGLSVRALNCLHYSGVDIDGDAFALLTVNLREMRRKVRGCGDVTVSELHRAIERLRTMRPDPMVELLRAAEGVMRIADRDTVEFNRLRAAIIAAKEQQP